MFIRALQDGWKNLYVLFSLLWEQKLCFVLTVSSACVQAAIAMVLVILPKYILDELLGTQDIPRLLTLIVILAGSLLLGKGGALILQQMLSHQMEIFSYKVSLRVYNASMQMKLEKLESSEMKDAVILAQDSNTCISCLGLCRDILTQIFTIIGTLTVLWTFEIWIFVIVLLALIMKIFSQFKELKAWQSCRDKTSSLSREGIYISNFGLDPSGAKEVRLHRIARWLNRISAGINEKACRIFSREFKSVLLFQTLASFFYALQLAYCYLVLTWNVVLSIITLGSYSMYLSAILTLTQSLDIIASRFAEMKKNTVYIQDLQKLYTQSEPSNDVVRQEVQLDKDSVTIAFENVWFRYPYTETDILKDINFQIQPGEKIALVGMNGAGKSTLIKLLCRFYKPTRGRITLNGRDIETIPYTQYIDYLSVVFQDFKVFAFTIQENIEMGISHDKQRLVSAIEGADLTACMASLPKGIETNLFRQFDDNGMELSGGQTQKLVLARSLYKNAPIFILDEPTASLDPLAEYELYHHFYEIAAYKTAVFISHRLSGSLFCDRVLVLEGGRIVQQGTHKQLIAEEGLYKNMFLKQSEGYGM